jgi:hypothetical protein
MTIQPGQVLARPKIGPIAGLHYGVAVNERYVFHNTQDHGAHVADGYSFAAGQPVFAVGDPVKTPAEYQTLLNNVVALQGKPYDAVFFNCEDAASEARFGIRHSPTREKVVMVAASCVVFWLLVKALDGN